MTTIAQAAEAIATRRRFNRGALEGYSFEVLSMLPQPLDPSDCVNETVKRAAAARREAYMTREQGRTPTPDSLVYVIWSQGKHDKFARIHAAVYGDGSYLILWSWGSSGLSLKSGIELEAALDVLSEQIRKGKINWG